MDLMEYINLKVSAETTAEFLAAGGITLGQMTDLLEAAEGMGADMDATIDGLFCAHSYRGYYERLAFEEGETTLRYMLERARACDGRTFERWKGGEFTMSRASLVHVAQRGCTEENDELTLPRLLAIIKSAQDARA